LHQRASSESGTVKSFADFFLIIVAGDSVEKA
jgi:hypothetical protein